MEVRPRGRRGAGVAAVVADGDDDAGRLVLVIDVFRAGALAYAVVTFALDADRYRRPGIGWLVFAVLAVWTGWLLVVRSTWFASGGPSSEGAANRSATLMVTDLVLVVVAVLATRLVDDPVRIEQGAQTLPSFYAAAAVLSWAVRWEWRGGLVAGIAVAAADLVEVRHPGSQTVANIVLIILGGLVVGYAQALIRHSRTQLAAAVAERSATAERERLARDIHDSVLQVLGFVHRAGAGQPGQAGELAALAGEQEVRLRTLIATGPGLPLFASPGSGRAGDGAQPADLRAELMTFAGERVTISAPADPVLLPALAVVALAAATGEALSNVRKHAGDLAQAWVLVEDEPDAVTVTIRDDGPGLPPGRLDDATQQGRLGVRMSICGRIEDIGGQVLISGPAGQGTEVEMRVPRHDRPGRGRRLEGAFG